MCPELYVQVWINQGDIVLIGLRDYQDAKADVILRYNPDEARNLKTYGELPESGELINNCIVSSLPVCVTSPLGLQLS